MRVRPLRDVLIRVLAWAATLLAASVVAFRPIAPIVRAGDLRPEALILLEEIRFRYPDRKTSSYEAGQFLSFAAAHLTGEGWFSSISDYDAVMKSYSESERQTTFVRVSGQNLLAFSSWPPPQAIDLLLVAPYDTLTPDEAPLYPLRPYTAEASAFLLGFASDLAPSEGISVALALVSGHHQLGAGTEALLRSLAEGGHQVRSAVVLSDMFSSAYLPIVPHNGVAERPVLTFHETLSANGLNPHIASRNDKTWYEAVSKGPPRAPSVESLLGIAGFPGEGSIFAANGIRALTLGFPRGGHLAGGAPDSPDAPDPERAARIGAALGALARNNPLAGGLPVGDALTGDGPADSPLWSGNAVFQGFGRLALVPRKTVMLLGVSATVLGTLALVLYRHLLSKGGLALMGGIALAVVLSPFGGWAAFSRGAREYVAWFFPVRAFIISSILFVGLTLLCFLRMWNVRSRIANLHKRIPTASTEEVGPALDSRPDTERTTAGAWGTAVMVAVAAGTGLATSPFFPYALAASILMLLATVIEGERSRRRRPLGFWVWVNRMLYLAPLGAALLWAGSPMERESLALLQAEMVRVSPEILTSLLSVTASAASLVSTLRFPKPASKGRRGLLIAAELLVLVGMLLGVVTLPDVPGSSLPASAVAYEYYGDDARLVLMTPRPLGQLTVSSKSSDPNLGDFKPVFRTDGEGRLSVGLPPISAEDWATVEVTPSMGESSSDLAFTATLPERPTFLALRILDTRLVKSASKSLKPTELLGVDAMLGVSVEDGGESEAFVVPSDSSVSFIWWYPPERSFSRQLGITLSGSTRVDVTLEAVHVGRSYLKLDLRSPGASFVNVTSVSTEITVR